MSAFLSRRSRFGLVGDDDAGCAQQEAELDVRRIRADGHVRRPTRPGRQASACSTRTALHRRGRWPQPVHGAGVEEGVLHGGEDVSWSTRAPRPKLVAHTEHLLPNLRHQHALCPRRCGRRVRNAMTESSERERTSYFRGSTAMMRVLGEVLNRRRHPRQQRTAPHPRRPRRAACARPLDARRDRRHRRAGCRRISSPTVPVAEMMLGWSWPPTRAILRLRQRPRLCLRLHHRLAAVENRRAKPRDGLASRRGRHSGLIPWWRPGRWAAQASAWPREPIDAVTSGFVPPAARSMASSLTAQRM